MSAQAQPAPDIAHLLKATEDYVRTIRRILHERGESWQATKTWKGGSA